MLTFFPADKFNSTVDGDSSGTTVQCQSLILYRQQREAFWCTLAAIPLRLPKKRRQNSSARTGGTDGPDPPPTKKSKKKAGGAKELMTVLLPINVSSETKIVGSYALGRILGKGAFSKVRLGRHLESDKLVAVKIIKTRTRQEAAVLKAASGAEKTELVQVHPGKDGDHEARILQCMSHKNIITLIEVLRTTRKMFIVMEYAGGGEFFKQIVNRDGGLCEIDVRRWFSQLISAVRYMHKSGVVHRDLKPENIVLDSQRKLIKIIDFGLASTFDPTNPQRHFTACGTRRFQAPEVGSEEGYLGAPVDVYSLGVILCEAVFGHELDLGDDPKTTASLIAQHLDKPSTQISRICKDLIKGMTRLEPKSRLTVEDVWKHPWLATSTGNVPTHAQQQARLRSTRRSRDVSEGNTPAPRPSSAASRRTSHTSHASHASGPQRRPPSWQDQKKNHSTIGSVTNSSGPSSRRTSDSSRLSNSSSRCSSVAGTATAAGACLEDEEVQKVLSKSKQGDECQLEWRFNGDTPVEAVSPGSYSSSSTSALSPANQRRRTIRAPVMIPSATASTAMTSPTGLRVADMNLTTSSPDAKRVESTSVETSGSGCSGTTSFAISVTEPANKLSGRIRSSSPDGKEGASHSNDNHFQELSLCADRPVIELGGPQPQQSPRELRLVVPESCSEPRVGSPLQHDLQAPFPTRPISQPPTQQSAVSLSDSETEKQIRNYLRNGTNLYPDSGHAMIRSPGRGGNGSAGTGGVGRSPLCGDADPEDGPQLQSVPAAPALRRHSEPILSPISAIPVTDRERDSDPVSGRQPITKRLEKRSIVASLRRLPASSAGTSTTTHTHVLTQSHTHSTWLPKGHPATDPLLRQARPPPAPAPSPSPAANGATQSKVGKKKINAFPTRPILRKKRIASPSPSTSRIESPSVETRPVGISSINSSANSRASSSELRLPKTHEPNSFNPGGGFERGTSSSSCSGALGTSLDLDANSVKPARPETQPRRNSNVTSLPAFSAPKSTVIPLRSMSHVGRRDTARRGVAKL
eukprot:Rmarinus@m.1316